MLAIWLIVGRVQDLAASEEGNPPIFFRGQYRSLDAGQGVLERALR